MNEWIKKSIGVILLLALTSSLVAAPRVELELSGLSGTAAHEWGRAMAKTDFSSVRIVAGNEGGPSIKLSGSPGTGTYRVRGVIDSHNQLRLPHVSFGKTNTDGINQWIESLGNVRTDAITGESAARMAFGLSAAELVSITESLSRTVQRSTKGRPSRDILREMNDLVGPPIVMEAAARSVITPAAIVAEEFSGLAVGTGLAAVLRPLGLVMVPQRKTGSTRFIVRSVKDVDEHWPVGWPAAGAPRAHLPKLYDFLEVEIDQTPLSETMEALQARLEVPILFDQNGMARQRIDAAKVLVSFPLKRTFYSRILKTVLSQAKLKYELRLDEADRPFLWVSPR